MNQLISNDGAQVQMRLASTPSTRMPFATRDLAREPMREVLIDLETALSDRRPERGTNSIRLRADALHRAHTRLRDSRDDAAPSGMDRRDDFALRIDHQNRHAIGARDGEQDAWLCGHHPVARRLLRDILSRHDADAVAMHLMHSRDRSVADLLAQAAPVLIDMRNVISDPVREIEALK